MPHPRGGWGNTGDLTNRGVKFPTTGAKSAVKFPLCPHSLVGNLTTPQGWLSAYFMPATSKWYTPVASKIIASRCDFIV